MSLKIVLPEISDATEEFGSRKNIWSAGHSACIEAVGRPDDKRCGGKSAGSRRDVAAQTSELAQRIFAPAADRHTSIPSHTEGRNTIAENFVLTANPTAAPKIRVMRGPGFSTR